MPNKIQSFQSNNSTIQQFNNSPLRRGFTLIEILIVIAVTLVLLSLTYAGYTRFNQRQIVTNTGQNLKNILRDIQSRAYNGEIDCDVCDCANPSLAGWYVDFGNKIFYGQCGSTPFSERPLALSSEIVISILPSISILSFHNSPPSVSDAVTICLSHENLSDTYYKITVNLAGMIDDAGGLVEECP